MNFRFETCLPQKWIFSISTFADNTFEYSLEAMRRSKFNVFVDPTLEKQELLQQEKKVKESKNESLWIYSSRSELIEKIKAHERRIKELTSQIADHSDDLQKSNGIALNWHQQK